MIWMPRAAKNGSNQPPRPNRITTISPTMTGDTASGRSTMRAHQPPAREPIAGQHQRRDHAEAPPVTTTVTTSMMAVSTNACRTSGSRQRLARTIRPGRQRRSDRQHDPRQRRHQSSDRRTVSATAIASGSGHATVSRPRRRDRLAHAARPRGATSALGDEHHDGGDPNRSVATAAASAYRNWLVSWKMNTGAVSVLPGDVAGHDHDRAELTQCPGERQQDARPRCPAGARAGRPAGTSSTRRRPATRDASSSAGSSSSRTGSTVRTTSGSVITSRARTMPSGAKMTLQPDGLERAADRRARSVERDEHDPGDQRGDREGQVDEGRQHARPGNRYRTRTKASSVPKTPLMTATTGRRDERQLQRVPGTGCCQRIAERADAVAEAPRRDRRPRAGPPPGPGRAMAVRRSVQRPHGTGRRAARRPVLLGRAVRAALERLRSMVAVTRSRALRRLEGLGEDPVRITEDANR